MITRTCIVCKQKFEQKDLSRIVLFNQQLNVQTDKKLNGRGAYVCKNPKCVQNLVKTKALNRAFKQNINLDEYQKILNILND